MTPGDAAVGRTAVVEAVSPRHGPAAPGPAEDPGCLAAGRGPAAARHDQSDEVVVGTDGSAEPQRALSWARREARLRGAARVTAVAERVADLVHASARASVLVLGPPLRGPVRWHLRGGCPASAVARASCPVVVVRGPDPDIPAEHWKAVVVGVDEHDQGDAVVAFAAHEALLRHVPLRVVATWSLPTAAGAGVAHFQGEALSQWAQSMADDAGALATEVHSRARAAAPGLAVTSEVVNAPAAEALASRSHDAQLLVVGRGGSAHRVGPVARALLHQASCPVAVVPGARGGGSGS